MTEHERKNKTRQNKNKQEIKLAQEFIGFFPSSIQVKGTLFPLQNLSSQSTWVSFIELTQERVLKSLKLKTSIDNTNRK